MSYTKTLAAYAAGLSFEDIPEDVLLRAKYLTLQTLGVSLAAVRSELGRRAVALGRVLGAGGNDATVWGEGSRLSAPAAGLVNGTLADALDWEDCSWTGHPSACAVSTGFALGEQIGASGRDYLLALVTAYELYERIAMAVQPASADTWFTKGWGLVCWAIYASSIAGGKLLKLNAGQMENLIGISGPLSGPVSSKVHINHSDYYHFQWGLDSYSGIAAAHLAGIGISPLQDFLDGESGYWNLTGNCRWEWYDKNLGSQWMIMETLLKHWPANMWIQQPLDALHCLIRKHRITPQQVRGIVVSPEVEYRWFVRPEGYDSIMDAQFSVPYTMSAMLHEPTPSLDWYSERNRHDPSHLQLAAKIHPTGPVHTLWDCFAMFQKGDYPFYTVTLETIDGAVLTEEVPLPVGHPKNMASEEDFRKNFHYLTDALLGVERAEQVIALVLNLEQVGDVGEIIRAMRFAQE